MIEIIVIWQLCKKIGAIDKGRTAWPFQVLTVLLWIGGEFTGAVVTYIGCMIVEGPQAEPGLLVYVGALLGAGLGALLAWLIASGWPAAEGVATPRGEQVCPSCGEEFEPGLRTCPLCGHAIA